MGFFHRPRAGRPSLALDLAEEFCALTDRFVVSLIRRRLEPGAPPVARRGQSIRLCPVPSTRLGPRGVGLRRLHPMVEEVVRVESEAGYQRWAPQKREDVRFRAAGRRWTPGRVQRQATTQRSTDDMSVTLNVRASKDAIRTARRLNPEFPGELDQLAWQIGLRWCHPERSVVTNHDAKDTDRNYLAVCRAPEAAENGLRLDVRGNLISITVLTLLNPTYRGSRSNRTTLMIALVDYDNLRVGGRDIRAIVQQLLDEVGVARCEGERAVRFRLYGGWFEGLHLSRRAQRLSAAIDSRFPRRMSVVSGELAVTLMVTVELARRLVDDRIDLTHTYRRWSTPPTLSCLAAPFEACARPGQCALSGLAPFVNNAQCPVPACGVTPPAVLKKEEQKLVDSMLVVDLVHLAETRSEPIVLASSDDDMWPGIRAALLRGAQVVHVGATAVPRQYERLVENYAYAIDPKG